MNHRRPIDEVLPQKPRRNYERVRDAALRIEIEPPFNALHDELQECYYYYWKHGKSAFFFGYDKGATIEESKKTFDKLHGLIWHLCEIFKAQKGLRQDVTRNIDAARKLALQGYDLRPALEAISPFKVEF